LIKLLIKLAVVAIVANATWRIGSAYVAHYKFTDSVQQTTLFRGQRTDEQLRARVPAGHRADFEHERERADRLMAELKQARAEVTAAREAAARFEAEVALLRARARTDSSIDKAERQLGQLAATLVEADRKAARG